MPLDAYKNFAAATLAAGINSSATSLSVASGQGARFPAAPFNATIYNATDYASADEAYHAGHAEIVRVTARTTDALTITRAQESTAAVNLDTAGKTYRIVAGLTAKFSGDLPAGEVTLNGAQTLTGKRITKRVSTLTTTATLTPDIDSFDAIKITAQSGNLTIATPTGTPTDDQATLISVRAIGGPCQITVSSGYSIPSGSSFASPYTLASGTRIRFAIIYDAASGKHDIMTASPGLP